MANNSNRKAIEFMVQGALPPHSTNVLWMDTSVPTLPVLKTFENGAWTTVHTEQGKVDELLAKTVLEQAKLIDTLTNGINTKLDTVTEDLGKTVDSLDTVTEDLNTLQQTVATEENATANKNELKQHIIQENRNIAGDCIIPDFELPCLPFVPEGFCAIYGDADYVIGDFDPQTVAEQFEVGSIIHVTGDNATEDEFEGYPEGSLMAVAKTTLEPTGYAEGLYQDFEGHMQGITENIIWQKGGYYRVTGIVECYSEITEGSFTIFTYKEINPGTITNLGKQVYDKIDKQVARESTSQEIKELVLREGIILANEYAKTINDIVGDFSNE